MTRVMSETITIQSFRGIAREMARVVAEALSISESSLHIRGRIKQIVESLEINELTTPSSGTTGGSKNDMYVF